MQRRPGTPLHAPITEELMATLEEAGFLAEIKNKTQRTSTKKGRQRKLVRPTEESIQKPEGTRAAGPIEIGIITSAATIIVTKAVTWATDGGVKQVWEKLRVKLGFTVPDTPQEEVQQKVEEALKTLGALAKRVKITPEQMQELTMEIYRRELGLAAKK